MMMNMRFIVPGSRNIRNEPNVKCCGITKFVYFISRPGRHSSEYWVCRAHVDTSLEAGNWIFWDVASKSEESIELLYTNISVRQSTNRNPITFSGLFFNETTDRMLRQRVGFGCAGAVDKRGEALYWYFKGSCDTKTSFATRIRKI